MRQKMVFKMPYSVYRVLNTLNDKAYIGVSTNPKKRISAHLTGSGSSTLWQDVQKDGKGVFLSQIIETHSDAMEANRRMQTFIMHHNALHPFGYNKGIGGKGSSGHLWNLTQRAKVTGIKNNRSKLTEAQVAAIYWDPRSRSIIAKQYGISTTMVTKIKNGQAWKNVTRWLQ
jgi:predicted GIY-YIG superfamily endonuclease